MTQDKKAVVYALMAVILWSTVATAFKKSLELISAFDLLLFSTLWSAAVLGGLNFGQGLNFDSLRITKEEGFVYFLGALLNPVAYYLVLFYSYDLLPAQIAQPLNYTWPLMLVLLSIPILNKKPTVTDGIALLICFAGIILISRGGSTEVLGPLNPKGVFLALFSSILWALYWLVGNRQPGDQKKRLFWNFLLAVPVLLILKPVISPGYPELSGSILIFTAWVGFFEMGITFIFWGLALNTARHPAAISHLVYLSPFLSLFWISLILKEKIQFTTMAGLAVIVLGILFREFSTRTKIH